MKTIARALPHATIVLSGMLIVFLILDRFNPSMGYLDNPGERVLLIALATTSIANAMMLIGRQRRS
jgi:hypothetical protein